MTIPLFVIQLFSIFINVGVTTFTAISYSKNRKSMRKNTKISENFLEQARKQADRVNEIYKKELNYCRLCKTLIKLHK